MYPYYYPSFPYPYYRYGYYDFNPYYPCYGHDYYFCEMYRRRRYPCRYW